MSNNTILEANANTANEAKYKKSITVSNGTYNRLLKAGRFSDRSFDKVIARVIARQVLREKGVRESQTGISKSARTETK